MRKKLIALLRFALPYILTALIPLVSVFYFSNATAGEYESRRLEDQKSNIASAFNRFTDRMKALETNVYQIALNDITTQYTFDSILGRTHTAYENFEFQNFLQDYWMSGDAAAVFFYDAENNTVVSPKVSWLDATEYFKYNYIIQGFSPEQHLERLENMITATGYSPVITVSVDNAWMELVEYRLPLPIGASASHGCQLIAAVRADRVFGDIPKTVGSDGEYYFYDNKNTLIYSSSDGYRAVADSLTVPGYTSLEEVDAMVFTDSERKWTLKVITPVSNRIQGGEVPAYVTVLLLLSLATSTVLTVYFTFKNFRQLQEVLEIFTGKKTEIPESGYSQIKMHAEKIVSDNQRYREEMARYAGSRRYHLMDMLLRGTFENEDALLSDMEREQIRIPEGSKTVICVQCGDLNRVKKLLVQFLGEQTAVFRTSAEECVSILSTERLDILSLLHRLEEGSVPASAGDPVRDLRQLCVAYSQSKTVLRYREVSGCRVYRYEDVSNLENSFLWPKTYDDKLHNLIVSRNCEEAIKLVDDVYRSNFGPGAPMLSFRAIEALKGKLKNRLFSMADQYDIPVEDVLLRGDAVVNIGEFFRIVHEVILQMIEQLGTKNRGPSVSLAEQMRSYIDAHYSDPMLSVKQLSVQMGFHENYISAQFKNEFGEILSGYIERKRIEKASALLRSTNMRISEISEAVGYSTDISFRRAFKKLTGVSPATFREDVT